MDNELASDCKKIILERLAAAGSNGLTTKDLKLPSSGSKKGKICQNVLKSLLKEGEIGDLGSRNKRCYVTAAHFRPLETAYDHIEKRARDSGLRLGSKKSLSQGLKVAEARKADEALKLLVAEGVLIRLKWSNSTLYLHTDALPHTQLAAAPGLASEPPASERKLPDATAIHRAYRETVNEFGYPDVLIHEIYLRLGGELEPFKQALMDACRDGRAVPSIGDWSLSLPEERNAALYINGHPHLRVRFKE